MPSNVELAKASFAAFKAGDFESYVDSFSEHVQWQVTAFATGKSVYRGREGVREFLRDIERLGTEQGEHLVIDLSEFCELEGDRVIAIGEAWIKRKRDPLMIESGTIYHFEHGLITKLESYSSITKTRRAAGLEP